MLHFFLAIPPRWTQQLYWVKLSFVSLFCGSYWKPSQAKHGSSWLWLTQLVNIYFTENTTWAHLCECYHTVEFLLTFRYSSAELPPTFFTSYFLFSPYLSFLLSIAAEVSAMKHLHGAGEFESEAVSSCSGNSLTLTHTLSVFIVLSSLRRMLSWSVRTGCRTL